jgi:hypothetical protein
MYYETDSTIGGKELVFASELDNNMYGRAQMHLCQD